MDQAPEHEAEILAAVAADRPMAEILRTGPWDAADVATTLARHGLSATEGGSVVRIDLPVDQLLQVAQAGPDPRTARQAARAEALLTDIAHQLARRVAGEAAWDVRRRRRGAVEAWITWLSQELDAARVEHIRQQDPPPARRGPLPPTRPRPASLPDAIPDEEPRAAHPATDT